MDIEKRRLTSKTRTVKTEQENSFVGFSWTETETGTLNYIKEYENKFFHFENNERSR